MRPPIEIPDSELRVTFTASSGPGGQNVNKVATRAVVRWSVHDSASLNETERERVVSRLGHRITKDGELIVRSQKHRTQQDNLRAAKARLMDLVNDAIQPEKTRQSSGPPRAAVERRLAIKRRAAQIKALRRPPAATEDD
jgi:ribosome-associated protein